MACIAGLWLLWDYLDESHHVSQSLETPEGSYWHGIMHWREPDYGNSKYWFRRVGQHAIFPQLAVQARQLATARDNACHGFLAQPGAVGSPPLRRSVSVGPSGWAGRGRTLPPGAASRVAIAVRSLPGRRGAGITSRRRSTAQPSTPPRGDLMQRRTATRVVDLLVSPCLLPPAQVAACLSPRRHVK